MKTMLNIKTDKSVKDEAQKLAKKLGLPLSVIVNRYLKEFIYERKITFADHPTLNAKTTKELLEIENDLKSGKNMVGPFGSADAMVASLKK